MLVRAAAAVFLAVLVSGCMTAGHPPGDGGWGFDRSGVYHEVGSDQTLWRISRVYGVPLDEIIRANAIEDASLIKEGQRLLIPGADEVIELDVMPLEDGPGAGEFVWPAAGKVVAYFGHPADSYLNKGIQIRLEKSAAVQAARPGKVVFADHLPGYGSTVIIDHQDGLSSVYARNGALLKRVGERVRRGEQIGIMPDSSNPCLYFEIRKDGVADNPLFYLSK
ncbi:MAG: murein hydrolase activator EnvC family protein [Candidatus Omnitrophota bacterium]